MVDEVVNAALIALGITGLMFWDYWASKDERRRRDD